TTRLVPQQQWSRFRLATLVAPSQQRSQVLREDVRVTERGLPLVGDGRQRRVRPLTERFDEWRRRRGGILVVTDTETVARHVDPAAETAFVVVQRDEIGAFVRCEHRWGLRVAVLPDRALDRRPVETVKACADVRHAHTVPWTRPCARCLHCYKG